MECVDHRRLLPRLLLYAQAANLEAIRAAEANRLVLLRRGKQRCICQKCAYSVVTHGQVRLVGSNDKVGGMSNLGRPQQREAA